MYTKTQILNKVDFLISGAENSGFNRSKLVAMFQPLRNAIKNFYMIDFATYIEGNLETLTHGLIRLNTKYKNYQVQQWGNVPKGFNDLTELFVVGSDMMNTELSSFTSSITEAVLPSDEGDVEIYQSSMVDTWVNDWLSAYITVPANLELVGNVSGEIGLVSGLELLFDPPEIESIPSMADISKDIYINRKYKEVIECLGLSVYIPNNI